VKVAFLMAYDGRRYWGFARQPGVPTVEGTLLGVLKAEKLIYDFKSARCQVAARTDRGVSAIAQVVAASVNCRPDLDQLNASLPEDIALMGWAPVSSRFNPRREAQSKHYRYVCLPPPNFNSRLVEESVKLFEGIHDFRCFCKREKGRSTRGVISFASFRKNFALIFDFVGPFFLWQQVRRMVQALLELGRGQITVELLKRALNGLAPRPFRPAPPEGLFLARVSFKKLVFRMSESGYAKFVNYLKEQKDIRSREMLNFLRASAVDRGGEAI
jgi:tRNA pseudouridine38-40 synthase